MNGLGISALTKENIHTAAIVSNQKGHGRLLDEGTAGHHASNPACLQPGIIPKIGNMTLTFCLA